MSGRNMGLGWWGGVSEAKGGWRGRGDVGSDGGAGFSASGCFNPRAAECGSRSQRDVARKHHAV